MKILFSFCLFICLFSCGNSDGKTNNVVQDSSLSSLSKEQVEKLKFTEYLVDSKVEVLIKNWVKYKELEGVVANLKQGNLTYFKENSELLEALINDLKQDVPEALNSPSIISRLIALETKLYKLESLVNLSNSTPEIILSCIKEVLESFSDLNLQMNKKIERESQKIIKP